MGHSSKWFEFQKWPHLLVIPKMPKPILEIVEYCKEHFAYFCVIKLLVVISRKPEELFCFY